jgi:anti-repressor protein
MDGLIKVDADNQTVSARELHKELGIEKRFSAWFETNAQGFIEGEDFTTVLVGTEVQNNGGTQYRELTDHEITIDMAKHICLMSRTDKGKQCRQYLIDLEKAWNTPEQVFARALKMADKTIAKLKQDYSVLEERTEELETENISMSHMIEEMKPKITYLDVILESKSTVTVTQIAQDYGMSAKAFNKVLNQLHIQHKVGGQWILYAEHQHNGYVHSKTVRFTLRNGQEVVKMNTEWTQKGRIFLYETLKENEYYPLIETLSEQER